MSPELVVSAEGGMMSEEEPATLSTLGLFRPSGKPPYKGTEKNQLDPALEASLEDQEPESQVPGNRGRQPLTPNQGLALPGGNPCP